MYCDTQCVYCRLNYAIAYCRRNILRHTVVITLWYYTIVLFHFCTYCTAVLHAGIALYRWPGVRTSSPHAAFCLQTFRNHSAHHNYNPGQVSFNVQQLHCHVSWRQSMLCGLRHYTMLKRPEIYSWHIFVKKDIGGLSIYTLCYENYAVQGITLCCTGMGRDRAASIYSVWSARPPLCSYARPVSERWLNSSYMSAQFYSLLFSVSQPCS